MDGFVDDGCLVTIFSFLVSDLSTWKFTTFEDREDHRARVKLMLVCTHWSNLVKSKMKSWSTPGETPFLHHFIWDRLSAILNRSHTINVGNIQHLALRMCADLTDVIVQRFLNSCNKLISLDLSYCYLITDNSLKHLAASVHQHTLTSLDLEMCKRITNAGVIEVATTCTSITSLDISELAKVDDAALVVIATLPGLQHIELTYTSTMYHQGGYQSWSCIYCGVFYNLEISKECAQCDNVHVPNVTDSGACLLAKKTLRSASFRGRVKLTAALVRALCENCPNLERVDLGWCNLNMDSVEELVKSCKLLSSVHASRLGLRNGNDFEHLKKLFPYNTEAQVQQVKFGDAPTSTNKTKFDYTKLGVGDKVLVLDTVQKWYVSRVMGRETKGGNVYLLVHYDGWSKKWDEWNCKSERFAPLPSVWAAPF